MIELVHLGGAPGRPLLVLGPSLGTSAETLWGPAAERLAAHFEVLAWDLPGHGRSPAPEPGAAVTMPTLAAGVRTALDRTDGGARTFHYAGDSVGGAVGLQLLLDAPERVRTATLLCTGASIGTPGSWHERIDTVRHGGTSALVEASAQRWFGPGFLDREPAVGAALLDALAAADDIGYAAVCGALATFDVRHRLGEITTPVLAVAGAHDVATPPDSLAGIASGVRHGDLEVLPGVAHLAPAEAPARVAELVRTHAGRHDREVTVPSS
ncbi:alpha/beta fold hydrolase [Pseudonocardia sp. HH130630-07]|uniref:alpha/beta fold hydrolase n=1 Tax=Pseudonocardia sp. HH130630-07 TaxID=1690815 RepID=UPI000814E498|nr:alpha/beta fold hydrolase [Pseudonocardia sp. HH130630-07]ANY08889.1 hypothetical protein AFB00_24455 [Pseudonocardia sp. HH130630-07]